MVKFKKNMIRKMSYMERWITENYHGANAFGIVGQSVIPKKFATTKETAKIKGYLTPTAASFREKMMREYANPANRRGEPTNFIFSINAPKSDVKGFSEKPISFGLLKDREEIFNVWTVFKDIDDQFHVIQQNVFLYFLAHGACHWYTDKRDESVALLVTDEKDTFIGAAMIMNGADELLILPESWKEKKK